MSYCLKNWYDGCGIADISDGDADMSDGDEDENARERLQLELAIRLSLEREESFKNQMEGGEVNEGFMELGSWSTSSGGVEEAVRKKSSVERWLLDD